jgi:hypothetical protein
VKINPPEAEDVQPDRTSPSRDAVPAPAHLRSVWMLNLHRQKGWSDGFACLTDEAKDFPLVVYSGIINSILRFYLQTRCQK